MYSKKILIFTVLILLFSGCVNGIIDNGPTESRQKINLFFINEERFVVGNSPYEEAVIREIDVEAIPEVEVINQLLKGPREGEEGLTTNIPESVDFKKLEIKDKIAHTYFTGPLCDNRGAAYHAGMLVFKNLAQFTDTIEFVKIYLDGETQQPGGERTDSIPVCLEP